MTGQNLQALIHRANELARSGAYRDVDGVIQHLMEEGFVEADKELGASSERIQINLACEAAFNAQRS